MYPQTSFIQVARILASNEAALKPLRVLIQGIAGLGAVSNGRVSIRPSLSSFALECTQKNHPPIILVKSSDFTDLYPQFAAAPQGDRVCLLTLIAPNDRGRKPLAELAAGLRIHSDVISSALAEDGSWR